MTADLEFTGERYVPGTAGEIAHEHWHRYAFARRFAANRRVADVACGEGYGCGVLAEVAAHVTGIDIDARTLDHARRTYVHRANVTFVQGSAAALPLADASIDAVVSFETIEHLAAADQPRMLAEFARVLAPDGVLVLSSPNRPQYSDARGYANPFHVHELDRDELARLLAPHFPAQRWHCQRRYLGSALWAEEANGRYETLAGDARSAGDAVVPEAMYFVVVAARAPAALPRDFAALSLFTDSDDAELARIDHEAREVLRLDGLLKTRDGDLREQHARVNELQAMVVHRDALLEARAQAEAALRQALGECQRQVEAQERIIAYRASVRWWLALPWLRLRRLWNRIRAA
ncbi:MAG TPA: class I SAM-dependent methyltransferase [Casimicrobiaceae bacterium]